MTYFAKCGICQFDRPRFHLHSTRTPFIHGHDVQERRVQIPLCHTLQSVAQRSFRRTPRRCRESVGPSPVQGRIPFVRSSEFLFHRKQRGTILESSGLMFLMGCSASSVQAESSVDTRDGIRLQRGDHRVVKAGWATVLERRAGGLLQWSRRLQSGRLCLLHRFGVLRQVALVLCVCFNRIVSFHAFVVTGENFLQRRIAFQGRPRQSRPRWSSSHGGINQSHGHLQCPAQIATEEIRNGRKV